jgi:hypothetical protein
VSKKTAKKITATALKTKLNLSDVFVKIKLIVDTINPNIVTRMINNVFFLGVKFSAMIVCFVFISFSVKSLHWFNGLNR